MVAEVLVASKRLPGVVKKRTGPCDRTRSPDTNAIHQNQHFGIDEENRALHTSQLHFVPAKQIFNQASREEFQITENSAIDIGSIVARNITSQHRELIYLGKDYVTFRSPSN